MTDTTSETPDGAGPSPQEETAPVDRTAVSTSHVRLTLLRWVLAPCTTWQARRLAREFGPGIDAQTAWVMARLAWHTEEREYAMRYLDAGEDTG